MPPLSPKPPTLAASRYDTPAEADLDPAPSSEPVEGLDEWKSTYEGYTSQWQAESAEARERALATQRRIEEVRAAERKAASDLATADRGEREAKQSESQRKERLRRELGDSAETEEEGLKAGRKEGSVLKRGPEENQSKVKDAWEMVRPADEGVDDEQGERKEVVTDATGVIDADVEGGQTNVTGEGGKSPIKQVGHVISSCLTV